MTKPTDESLHRELRETLRRRDPGAAPSALHTWVLDVPDEAELSRPSQPRRLLATVLGLAAVILLAIIGLTTLRHIGPATDPGATVPTESAASPAAVESPVAAFDPKLEGPGISATDDLSPAIIVLPTCALLVALAFTTRGRRRVLPAALAAALAGWASLGTLLPVAFDDYAYAPGLNTVHAAEVPGSAETLFYELAPSGGRFSVGLGILAGGPLPIRIEGVVSPAFEYRDHYIGMLLTAVWIDGEPNGGMTGPIRPFAPFEMSRNGQSIWLVGRAGACALGTDFDPTNPGNEMGFEGIEGVDVRISVLGWPRTVHLGFPFRLVEPTSQTCSGPTPDPSSSPSASSVGR